MDRRRFLILALATAGAFRVACAGATEELRRTYTVGVVPQRTERETFAVWAPILREWEKRAGAKFEFVGARGLREFEGDMFRGRYDFVYANPYAALRAADRLGYVPLVCSGSDRLQGLLITSIDSEVDDPRQLPKDARIAFSSPNAFVASLVVRADLTRQQIRFEPVYVRTQSSVVLQVAQRLIDAGGVADSMLEQAPADLRDKVKIIYRSAEVTPHPLLAHPGVPVRVRIAVRDTMIALSAGDDGRALLAGIPMRNPRSVELREYRGLESLNLDAFMEKVD